MSFNLKTVPKIRLTEDEKNDVKIFKKNDRYYYLFTNKGQVMMYDLYTNKEAKELYSSYDLGYGKILMGGLGFGILALWLANKPEVKSIHIIEISQEVVDIFLSKNTLPPNVTIEIADVDTYKTDTTYDCILLDHYEFVSAIDQIKSMKQIAQNVPNHTLFWSWAMESVYVESTYNLDINFSLDEIIDNQDFFDRWNTFKKETLAIPTVPDLTEEKFKEYICTYADKA
jgi:hypothetical protein